MNLGWIRSLFTLSPLEKGRIKEAVADPRDVSNFREIENTISGSLVPPVVETKTTSRILNEDAQPKRVTKKSSGTSLLDQELVKKLLQQRPNYNSSRVLRANATPSHVTVNSNHDDEVNT
ncbi:MAG: hypothetical protein JST80_03150 [Bdellovibrionales bacterium]|nr:hypothetical protein [Bdellovibrionales bacterium]